MSSSKEYHKLPGFFMFTTNLNGYTLPNANPVLLLEVYNVVKSVSDKKDSDILVRDVVLKEPLLGKVV